MNCVLAHIIVFCAECFAEQPMMADKALMGAVRKKHPATRTVFERKKDPIYATIEESLISFLSAQL